MSSIKITIQPPVIAHRGASYIAPENTLASFRKAKEQGATWVEFDVMLSADNEIVVIHDETLDRTTNGKGLVIDYPYSYLKTLDAGSWFDSAFSNQHIPTLIEVIHLLNELNLSANVEIKAQIGKEELTVKKVLDILDVYWNNKNQVLISSFSLVILNLVRQYSKERALGFLMDEWDDQWEAVCDRLNCITVNVNNGILNPENVALIKKSQRLLLAYTVNDSVRAKELFSWGVDGVFSDVVKLLPAM